MPVHLMDLGRIVADIETGLRISGVKLSRECS